MVLAKVRNAKIAAGQHVKKASSTRKPRHVDNALVAISYLHREKNKLYFTTEEVLDTIESLHEVNKDPDQLGRYWRRNANTYLSDALIRGDYLTENEDGTVLSITRAAQKLMMKIADIMATTTFENYQRHRTHCDHFRQRVGSGARLSYKELERTAEEERQRRKQERKEHKQTQMQYQEHLSTCTSQPVTTLDSPRTTSAASDISLLSTAIGNDDSMDDEPVAGPSSQPYTATPVRRTSQKSPEDAYMTPVSLPRQGSMHQHQPVSTNLTPSRSRDSFALLNDYSDDMDIDDDTPDANPLDHSIRISSAEILELAAYRTQFGEVSTLLGVPASPLEHMRDTIQETLTAREKDLHAMAVQYVDACDRVETLSNELDICTQRLAEQQEETEMEIVHGLLLEQKCEGYRAAGLDQARKMSALAQMGMGAFV